MRMLKGHMLFFDEECPMCDLYTKAMVKSGMIETEGRRSYQDMPESVCPLIDRQMAANEIALINLQTGEVTYGIASMFKIIYTNFPILKWFLNNKLAELIFGFLYKFIAYNRRVIVPAAKNNANTTFQPAFKIHYRVLYLLITWLFTSIILSNYTPHLNVFLPSGIWYREYLICAGQIFFQGILVLALEKQGVMNYLGNMMTISFVGAITLGILLVLQSLFTIPSILFLVFFFIVVGLMFFEHLRRMRSLGYSLFISIGWVIYRLLILVLLLFA